MWARSVAGMRKRKDLASRQAVGWMSTSMGSFRLDRRQKIDFYKRLLESVDLCHLQTLC